MITPKQVAALRYLIFIAKNGNDTSKRLLAFLIESSNGLTNEVCLTLFEDREGYTAEEIQEVSYELGCMVSCNGSTHINEILQVMGSELSFSHHYGDFDPSRVSEPFNCDGQFAGVPKERLLEEDRGKLDLEGMPLRYTFWLSKTSYSRQATPVVTTREGLEKINLKKPGLYPELEPHG